MPLYAKTNATGYGNWGDDKDLIGTQAKPTFTNKDRRGDPLGVDIPFMARTATGDMFKPFKVGNENNKGNGNKQGDGKNGGGLGGSQGGQGGQDGQGGQGEEG